MSVNKPTKITPPSASEDTGKDKRGSLLERASGAFGLDKLAPAKVREDLPKDQTKRMPTPKPAPEVVVKANAESPAISVGAEQPKQARTEPTEPAVQLRGSRHEVSRERLADQGFIDPDGGASTLLEEFRIIKRQILATAADEGTQQSRRVLICSPHSGEGKTFCAVNLAIAMAGDRDREVLLIDADFAKPSIMSVFGLESGPGLMDALADPSIDIEDLVVGTDIPGLWLLPAGKHTGRDSEYLASERTWEILSRLTRGADNRTLVFDSPPALAASPAAELAKHVGQALLIARADETARAAIEDALDLISACPDIRLLLNDATFSPSGRKFGSYYG